MRIKASLFVSVATFSPSNGLALGIRTADQDPATKRSNSITTTADNPSAIYYSPAGTTQLEDNNVSIGVGRRYNHWRWDMAYQLAYGPERNVTGSTPQFLDQ